MIEFEIITTKGQLELSELNVKKDCWVNDVA